MKAAIRSKYGLPSVLMVQEVEKPNPGEDEVLIKLQATTVNRTDCALLSAKPFIMRFITGLVKPKSSFVGTDFAGTIEAVGNTVKSFKIGDKVWGFDDIGLGSSCPVHDLSCQQSYIAYA